MGTGAGGDPIDLLGVGRVGPDAQADDEAAAVRDALQGNPAAFGLFFERYGQRAYRSAVFLLGPDRADAEDIIQETFLDALRGLRTYRLKDPFYPWLYAILRRRVIRHRRLQARSKQPRLIRTTQDGDETGSASDPTEDADLRWALSRITLERREVLLLHHVLGYGMREIADMLGIPAGTVKSRLGRARKAMAKLLGEANTHAGRD